MALIRIDTVIILIQTFALRTSSDSCQRPSFDTSEDIFMNKDVDMCTMFIQSYTRSIDMSRTVKDYLLRYLPYSYLSDGHLHTLVNMKTIDKVVKSNN